MLVLVIIATAIFLARQISEHGGMYNAVIAAAKGCKYETPGPWRKGPYPVASRFCGDVRELQGLKNHMRVNCVGMEACTAGEFGSNVAVWYFPAHDVFLVNPSIAEDSGEMIACKRATGGTVHVTSPVTVTFLDENLGRATRSFHNRGACLVHAMSAETQGVSFL